MFIIINIIYTYTFFLPKRTSNSIKLQWYKLGDSKYLKLKLIGEMTINPCSTDDIVPVGELLYFVLVSVAWGKTSGKEAALA